LSVVVLRARAVEVELRLAAGGAAVCSGGSTVPAAVTIVVEYRARLSVGREIAGIAARSVVGGRVVPALIVLGISFLTARTTQYQSGSFLTASA
jgi:hypothetical protein